MNSNQQILILIVDDQSENLDSIMGFIKESNSEYKFSLAPNGKIACKVAEKRQPDLIIMDWEMPDMNGYEALIHLKKNDLTKDIPVVMATARSSTKDLERALEAGAADYIRKPIEKQELIARVRSCLSISHFIKKIKTNNEELLDLNREKDGIIGIVAHDLRSPLNKIKGFMQLINMTGELNDEQKDYFSKIDDVIKQGTNLIRDLLDVSAFENQDSKIDLSDVNLKEYLPELIATYNQELNNKSQNLKIELDLNNAIFKTDKDFLNRILDNLISNAIKFSENNKTIFFKAFDNDSHFVFSIKDQGPGISEDDQKKMFKKFQKLEARPTGGETSTGLGLSIIRALVDKLEGEIEVISELEIGSEFIVRLPKEMQMYRT